MVIYIVIHTVSWCKILGRCPLPCPKCCKTNSKSRHYSSINITVLINITSNNHYNITLLFLITNYLQYIGIRFEFLGHNLNLWYSPWKLVWSKAQLFLILSVLLKHMFGTWIDWIQHQDQMDRFYTNLESMPAWVQVVIKAKGTPTKY